MRSHTSSSAESGEHRSHVRRKARPCLGCGAPISRFTHEVGAALFCPTCVERPDDPVTAELYWDLGGNE